MGRKIPAKKHRGVKDPVVQQARRLQGLKGKINAPPRDPDEQPVPKSLLRLFGADKQTEERKKKLKSKKLQAKRGQGVGERKGGSSNPVAKLRRLPGESGRAFSRRITGTARALHDATDAQVYPVEEEEEEEPWRRRRRERAGAERPARAQRRRERLLERKKEQAEARSGALAAARREVQYERLPFGETAHAPPALPAPRLSAALRLRASLAPTSVPRPGQRELLLTRLLPGGGAGAGGGACTKGSAGPGAGSDAASEQRRLAAVAAYRALKASRRTAAAAAAGAAAGGAEAAARDR